MLSRVQLYATLCTVAHQAPLCMEFSRQEDWSGLPFPSPGDIFDPGIESGPPALQVESLPFKPKWCLVAAKVRKRLAVVSRTLEQWSKWGLGWGVPVSVGGDCFKTSWWWTWESGRAVRAVKDFRCHPGLSSTVPVRRPRSGCRGRNLPSDRTHSSVSVNG